MYPPSLLLVRVDVSPIYGVRVRSIMRRHLVIVGWVRQLYVVAMRCTRGWRMRERFPKWKAIRSCHGACWARIQLRARMRTASHSPSTSAWWDCGKQTITVIIHGRRFTQYRAQLQTDWRMNRFSRRHASVSCFDKHTLHGFGSGVFLRKGRVGIGCLH